MMYYDLYLQCGPAAGSCISVSGWTHCAYADGEEIQGIKLKMISPDQTGVLPLSFKGFVRFEIPEEGRIDGNQGLCLEIDAQSCAIPLVLLNNEYDKPTILSADLLTFADKGTEPPLYEFPSLFPVRAARQAEPVNISKDNTTLSFVFDNAQDDEYLLVYAKAEGDNYLSENACDIFCAKNNYLPNEPITVTYRNLYEILRGNSIPTNIMFYMDEDIPGRSKSREYVILKYGSAFRGASGSVTVPRDGQRFYRNYRLGHYFVRLLQYYHPLCEHLDITVSDNHTETELNVPPAGALFYIKLSCLPGKITLKKEAEKKLFVFRFACSTPVLGVFEQNLCHMRLHSYFSDNDEKNDKLSSTAVTALLNFILYGFYTRSIMEQSQRMRRNSSVTQKLIEYIEENLHKGITMKKLCDKFGYSESFLSHTFKKDMNITISSYICRTKVSRAKILLNNNDRSISEIADMLHYSSVHSFSRAFKQIEGMSPSEYRNKLS